MTVTGSELCRYIEGRDRAGQSRSCLPLDKLGVSPERRQWIQLGLEVFQIFAFFKAGRARVGPGGACFVAGTDVIMGINPDGSFITKNIEEIDERDWVLARDQFDPNDDLDLRRVTGVFRKTSDHLRVLTIQGDGGNVETIKTTDEHPFYVAGAGWVDAGDLAVGARLSEADGTDAVLVSSVREEHAGVVAVFNFEVEGDHTYFVEDGAGDQTAVWAHNQCVGGKFFGTYKGKAVEFKNSSPGQIVFRKRPTAETETLRSAFDTERSRFVKHAATTKRADLLAAGFTARQIDQMALDGVVPSVRGQSFQVHHKKPLDGGGDNSFDNLIIMKQAPYHAALTTEQQRYVGGLEPGQQRTIDFPLFTGISV